GSHTGAGATAATAYMSLLASLEKVEAELHKVIEEVRSQAAGLNQQAEPEEVIKEDPTAERQAEDDGGFRGDPPVVMQQVLKDRSRNDDPDSLEGIRARQQAAVLRDNDTDERLNLQLSPHFMELSMRSGGALHSSGAHQAVGHLRFSSAVRSSRADLSEGLRQPDCGVIAPYSRLRFSWDLIGTCLIILDVVILPLTLAWQIDKKLFPIQKSFEAMLLQLLAWTNVLFWPLDVLLNFNTGFHQKGLLIMKRKPIAKNYVHTWLAFDVTVVLIDWTLSILNTFLEDENQGYLQTLRSARYLRAFRSVRILRIIKSRKMNITLENWVIGLGQQNLVLAFNVLRMLLSILLTAHLLACTWFGVGVVVSQTGESWIDVAGVGSSTGPVQYLHALSWVVQPPSVPELGVLNTDSLLERIASWSQDCPVVVTVLVIGSALSLLTGTLQEIRTINNQRSRKRRELRTYLHSQSAPTELVMRIMSFADYKLDRHSPVSYDIDLISPLLVAELAVWQKGHLMRGHPLFSLTSEAFPKVFADICGALHKELYYEGESAFLAGLLAESMYITSHGSFVLYDSHGQEMEKFSNDRQFFSEVALYVDTVMHNCTLSIETFAEVYSLSGKSITSILLHSPICASMFVEYAKEFIAIYSRTAIAHHQSLLSSRAATMSKKNSINSWQVDMKCAKGALKSNSFYMDMNLKENKVLKNVSLEDLKKRGKKQEKEDDASSPRMLLCDEDSEGTAEEYHNWPEGSHMHHEMFHHQDTSVTDPANSLVKALLQGQSFTAEQLQEAFVELHPRYGLHTMYSFEQEHEKAVCACFCLAALVTDDYDSFTEPQQDWLSAVRFWRFPDTVSPEETAKLHPSQWQELRNILKWADPTEDVLEAAFFLLAVRSLGKCRAVTRQLPREAQKPEEALLYIMDAALPLFIATSPGTISVLLVRDSTFHMIAQHRKPPQCCTFLRTSKRGRARLGLPCRGTTAGLQFPADVAG
ncbi:unnamed protein product, partial [Cladocopium goreaui]